MARIEFDLQLRRNQAGPVRADVFTTFINELARAAESAMERMEAEFAAELAKRDERIARLEGMVEGRDRGASLRSVRI